MNNTLCLGIFAILIFGRGLYWEYSAGWPVCVWGGVACVWGGCMCVWGEVACVCVWGRLHVCVWGGGGLHVCVWCVRMLCVYMVSVNLIPHCTLSHSPLPSPPPEVTVIILIEVAVGIIAISSGFLYKHTYVVSCCTKREDYSQSLYVPCLPVTKAPFVSNEK